MVINYLTTAKTMLYWLYLNNKERITMTQEQFKVEFQQQLDHIVAMKEMGERGVYADWFVEETIERAFERIGELQNAIV